jgi:hypothetical protein
LRGSPNQTSTGCFAFAGCREFFGDLPDRHINHLLSTPFVDDMEINQIVTCPIKI